MKAQKRGFKLSVAFLFLAGFFAAASIPANADLGDSLGGGFTADATPEIEVVATDQTMDTDTEGVDQEGDGEANGETSSDIPDVGTGSLSDAFDSFSEDPLSVDSDASVSTEDASDGELSTTGTVTNTTQQLPQTVQAETDESIRAEAGDTAATIDAEATQTVTAEDATTQPEDVSLLDKIIGIFTGGEEESTTTAATGVEVSTGETQVSGDTTTQMGIGGGETVTTEIRGTASEATQTADESQETITETASSVEETATVNETVTVEAGDTTVTAETEASGTATTQDLTEQPEDASLIDKIIGVFTGGEEEVSTTTTTGVEVQSGDTQLSGDVAAQAGLGGGETIGSTGGETVAAGSEAVTDTETTTTQTETIETEASTAEQLPATVEAGAGEETSVEAGDTTVSVETEVTQTVTTEDGTQQPDDSSLIDKIIDVFTGGDEESTTTATTGVEVSSGGTQVGGEADTEVALGGGESLATETVQEGTQATGETVTTGSNTVSETSGSVTEQLPASVEAGAGEEVSVEGGDTTVNVSTEVTETVTTNDLTNQPQGASPTEQVVGIISGGKDESSTTLTTGVEVSTGGTNVGGETSTQAGLGGGESTASGTVQEGAQTAGEAGPGSTASGTDSKSGDKSANTSEKAIATKGGDVEGRKDSSVKVSQESQRRRPRSYGRQLVFEEETGERSIQSESGEEIEE